MKVCSKCGLEKPFSEYFLYSGRPGYRPSCRDCMYAQRRDKSDESKAKDKDTRAKYLSATKARRSAWQRDYYAKNKELCKERVSRCNDKKRDEYRKYRSVWRKFNGDKLILLARASRAKFPERYREYKIKRRCIQRTAIPDWANKTAISAWYKLATVMPGFHVDHIVPLNSPLVCGLHCEFNLQLLPASENMSKGNRIWPDMP